MQADNQAITDSQTFWQGLVGYILYQTISTKEKGKITRAER